MNLNKLSNTQEVVVKTTGMLNSTTEIAKLVSNEYLKEIELKEYCKVAESDFIKYQKNFQDLISSKNQSAGMKAEYKSRNKINMTNSERFSCLRLLKALNELYKYKCELKLNYVTIEKELKLKKLKYKKIISGYESAWDDTLKNYNKTSTVAELLKIQKENQILESEIEKQEKLIASTKIQFNQLKENIGQNFYKTVVKFSKLMNSNLLTSDKQNEKSQSFKAPNKALDFKLFRSKAPVGAEKSLLGNENGDDANILGSIDVTIFDDLMVPLENLESQHLEEDGYSLLQNDTSKYQADGSGCLNSQEQLKNKKTRDFQENTVQDDARALAVEENESHYFRQQYLKQFQAEYHTEVSQRAEKNVNQGNKDKYVVEGTREILKSVINPIGFEDETGRDLQMECEESLSEGSYEKQCSGPRELYDHQKTSSISSEDLPPAEENPNENDGAVRKLCDDQQNKNSKPRCEVETNDFKSFTGFFTMGSDNDNPTPSIFKLF